MNSPRNHSCPKCFSCPVIIHEASDDWACQNENCEYFHGAQSVFEKNYTEWYKRPFTANSEKDGLLWLGIDFGAEVK